MIYKDYKARSSPGDLDQFLTSMIHKDFLGEIDCRINDMRDVLEVADSKSYIQTQGAIKFARMLKDVFNDMALNAKDDLSEEGSDV